MKNLSEVHSHSLLDLELSYLSGDKNAFLPPGEEEYLSQERFISYFQGDKIGGGQCIHHGT